MGLSPQKLPFAPPFPGQSFATCKSKVDHFVTPKRLTRPGGQRHRAPMTGTRRPSFTRQSGHPELLAYQVSGWDFQPSSGAPNPPLDCAVKVCSAVTPPSCRYITAASVRLSPL